LGDLGADGKIMIELIERKEEDMDWIHLDYGRNQWRILVNMVMNLRVAQEAGNFLTS